MGSSLGQARVVARDSVNSMRVRVACLTTLALAGCSTHHAPTRDAGPEFDVVSAQALSTLAIAITFSDPPSPTEAGVLANYTFEPAVVLAGSSTIAGATVTLGTMPQQDVTYRLTVAGITRQADGRPLTIASTTFAGHAPFDPMSAMSTGVQSVVLTFDAVPDATEATTLANYAITDPNPLALSGTPQLAGNAVTLSTAVQSAVSYDLDVFAITRASDHEPLYTTSVSFIGTDHCTDGVTDGDETDVDCGGPSCIARCALGKACIVGSDCTSNTCVGSICS